MEKNQNTNVGIQTKNRFQDNFLEKQYTHLRLNYGKDNKKSY